MGFQVDIWLRGDNNATTEVISGAIREPRAWTEGDVATVLTAMLRALDKAKHPDTDGERPVALRGFSWIVEPTSDGVVIAIEIPTGAAVAGPFAIAQPRLDRLITRVLAAAAASRATIH
jgi:hypothetical protein